MGKKYRKFLQRRRLDKDSPIQEGKTMYVSSNSSQEIREQRPLVPEQRQVVNDSAESN